MLRNKYFSKTEYFNITHWATNSHDVEGEWDWEKEDRPFCLAPKRPKEEMGELSATEKTIGLTMLDFARRFHDMFGNENSIKDFNGATVVELKSIE